MTIKPSTPAEFGKKLKRDTLYFLPAGGCGEFGKNLNLYIYNREIYVLDCGVMFADEHFLGVSGLIPKIDEFLSNIGEIKAYLITHGHEDHLGGLPYFYKKWPAPIFLTPWTNLLFQDKIARLELNVPKSDINIIEAGDEIAIGPLKASACHVNHSIPECVAFFLRFGNGKKKVGIFHSGDFKIEPAPQFEKKTDLKSLKAYGKEGVDYFVCDSTNAPKLSRNISEKDVEKELEKIIKDSPGRVFIATFASNVFRILNVLKIAKKLKRPVRIMGASMAKTVEYATRHGYDTYGMADLDKNMPNDSNTKNAIVIMTGSQGEYRSALYKLSRGEIKSMRLTENDLIIFSSRIIPGNEKSVFFCISKMRRLGVKVLTTKDNDKIHVSGHGSYLELKEYINCLKPKNLMPVHGTYIQIIENIENTRKYFPKIQHVCPENGNLFELGDTAKLIQTIDIKAHFIDDDNKATLDYDSLRARLRIGEKGLLIGILIGKGKSIRAHVDMIGLPVDSFEEFEQQVDHYQKAAKRLAQHYLSSNNSDATDLSQFVASGVRKEVLLHSRKKPQVFFYDFTSSS